MSRPVRLTLRRVRGIIDRMTRFVKLLIGVASVFSLVFVPPVHAQEMILQPSGPTEVDRLQAQCDTIIATLRRLHTNDALLRVNIGQSYNAISARLMARLNSRLALNRIDSSKFVEIANRFDEERDRFSSAYSEYETALSSLVRIDCKTRATEFYAALLESRDARTKLSNSVKTMNDNIREYRVAVEVLQQELKLETHTDAS